jgi:hypothetical protein
MDFDGKVRQIDVISGTTFQLYQVILSSGGGKEFVGVTQDSDIQRVCELSWSLSLPIHLEYASGDPNRITRVTLSSTRSAEPGLGTHRSK